MATTWANSTVRHGTQSGWRLHLNLNERPCDPCYAAKAEYDRDRRSVSGHVLISRLSARAQSMTNTQLRHNHPVEYKALYDANKKQLLADLTKELEQTRLKNSDGHRVEGS